MLRLAILFLAISLIAALLGFTGLAQGAAFIAKIIFIIFLVSFVVLLLVIVLQK